MENLAYGIALKANLFKICRLCGIDNPEKVPIYGDTPYIEDLEGEPELWQKIVDCVGFTITKNDNMPQSICTICVDKVNDFYDFREMCFANNSQTRKLLGLPNEDSENEMYNAGKLEVAPHRKLRKRTSAEIAYDAIAAGETSLLKTVLTEPIHKKLRLCNTTTRTMPNIIQHTEEIKNNVVEYTPPALLLKLRQLCPICGQRFSTPGKLHRHQKTMHIPDIPRYICIVCDETLKKGSDIKSHQLWHKITKTPYTCGCCDDALPNLYAYTRHLREHVHQVPADMLVHDRRCPKCRCLFVTNFLYNTHACAVRTLRCGGCNRNLRNETMFMAHAVACIRIYYTYTKHIYIEQAVFDASIRIKNENDIENEDNSFSQSVTMPSDVIPMVTLPQYSSSMLRANQCVMIPGQHNQKQTDICDMGSSKKSGKKGVSRKDLKRVDDLLKSTLDTLVSIKHEPEVYVSTDEDDATNCVAAASDNLQELCSEQNTAGNTVQDQSDLSAIVKKEVLDESCTEENLEINIKKEVFESSYEDDTTVGKIPVLKIKIKKEHGTLNSSLVDEDGTEKRKKKKKRKDSEKHKSNKTPDEQAVVNNPTDGEIVLHPDAICIKQEYVDNTYNEEAPKQPPLQTLMTSVPLMQLQISSIASGLQVDSSMEKNEDANHNVASFVEKASDALEDVKPDRAKLDAMLEVMKINNHKEHYAAGAAPQLTDVQPNTLKETASAINIDNALGQNTIALTNPISNVPALMEFQATPAISIGYAICNTNNNAYEHDVSLQGTSVIIKSEPMDDEYQNTVRTASDEECYHAVTTASKHPTAVAVPKNDTKCDSADVPFDNNQSKVLKNNDDDSCQAINKNSIENDDFSNENLSSTCIENKLTMQPYENSMGWEEREEKNATISKLPVCENSDLDVYKEAKCSNSQLSEYHEKNEPSAHYRETCIKSINDNKEGSQQTNTVDERVEGSPQQIQEVQKDTYLNCVGSAITFVGSTSGEKEMYSEARPFFDSACSGNQPSFDDTQQSDDEESVCEEEQNVANQEREANRNLVVDNHGTQMDESACSSSTLQPSIANEQTENLINENAAAALRQLSLQLNTNSSSNGIIHTVNHMLLDDGNINEIAENNNNANIERELRDDHVVNEESVQQLD